MTILAWLDNTTRFRMQTIQHYIQKDGVES